MVERLPVGSRGLDFGSGPGPTLSSMLEESGFAMKLFDPFFAPEEDVLTGRYDFITCTETVEHFFDPGREFARLNRLLVPMGWLGVMTELVDDIPSFDRWRYARDPTHVSLFRIATMLWIADHFGWSVSFPQANVVLFQKG